MEKFDAKIFSRYTDIVIFVLGYYNSVHPVDIEEDKNCVSWFAASRHTTVPLNLATLSIPLRVGS